MATLDGVVLGSKFKMLRDKSGLNQDQIAQFLGVDQSYISKLENDVRQFPVDALEKLCSLYGCEMADLLSPDDSLVDNLNFAFRSSSIQTEDLKAISDINRIALNLRQMRKLLEDK